jgi:prepilin-type N-terminal cleavage/methylation domain-containing protein
VQNFERRVYPKLIAMPLEFRNSFDLSSIINHHHATVGTLKGNRAFTLLEMVVVIAIIGILASIAISGFHYYMNKAYTVTVKHDLRNFVTAQEEYFAGNNRYLGATGDYIQGGNPVTGSLSSPEFKLYPADGVKIEITAGDGANPQGPPAFTAKADHVKATKRYYFNFVTAQMTEEDK